MAIATSRAVRTEPVTRPMLAACGYITRSAATQAAARSAGTPASRPPEVCGSNSSVRNGASTVAAQQRREREVFRQQRRADPGLRELERARIERNGGRVELGARKARRQHLAEMPDQAEPRHVGHRRGAVVAQDRGRGPVRLAHGGERRLDPRGVRARPHRAGEQHAGAERPCEDQRVTRLEPALADDALRRDLAGDREAERKLALARMTADQRHALAVEAGARAGEQLEQRLLDLPRLLPAAPRRSRARNAARRPSRTRR